MPMLHLTEVNQAQLQTNMVLVDIYSPCSENDHLYTVGVMDFLVVRCFKWSVLNDKMFYLKVFSLLCCVYDYHIPQSVTGPFAL